MQALSAQTQLSLPANAQLVRTFPSSKIALQIVTQPMIGEKSGDWPVLELGAASLVFSRNGSTGKLILVVGDQTPRDLPITYGLDANGRSLGVLTISFSRNGNELTVESANQKLQFPADPAAGLTTEIVASAGASQSWSLQNFSVLVGSVDPVPLPDFASGPTSVQKTAAAVAVDFSVGGNGPTPADIISAALAAKNGRTPKASAPANDGTTLEIYTPPSVRHGRTAAVRAAAQDKSAN